MRAWRVAVVTISIAAPLVGLTVMIGCDLGSPASPVAPPLEEASVVICPTLEPTFDSIRTNLLATDTCGSDRGGKCHSSGGATYSGGLDYTVDASALYEEFLGDSGTGHRAQNIATQESPAPIVYRVVPGDSGASLLYIKLTLHTKTDPTYGSGMPQDYPGDMCPSSIAAVQQWIDNGAKFVEGDSGAEVDAGEILDATTPDASDASDD